MSIAKVPTSGPLFEDFEVGQRLTHATPRTITNAEQTTYIALTGTRHPLTSSALLAQELGYRDRPIHDLLLFNIAFGKTVPDISVNAIANLGYANIRFWQPVFSGDTISVESTVVGMRETSDGSRGVVYVTSEVYANNAQRVLSFTRWVLLPKRDPQGSRSGIATVPDLEASASPCEDHIFLPGKEKWQQATQCGRYWDDYEPDTVIVHPYGMTIDASDHTLATKLYQNSANVHFDRLYAGGDVDRRIVYGGHVISLCSALSYAGLENMIRITNVHKGRHVNPAYAGDTIYTVSKIQEKRTLPDSNVGELRIEMLGYKNIDLGETMSAERMQSSLILEFEYSALMFKR